MILQTPQNAPPPDSWLTLAEGVAVAKFHHSTLRRAIRRGELRAARVGGRNCIRLKRAWIDAWLLQYAEPQERA